MKGFKIKELSISDTPISLVLLDFNQVETLHEYQLLFETCFGKRSNIDESLFDWLNNGAPYYANLNFAFVDQSTQQIIAAYGLQLGDSFLHGKIMKYALCTNVMTHPDFGGKGLFVEIGKEALAYAKSKGVSFCFGVPNEKAVKGHLKVGWNLVNEIHFFQREFSEIETPDISNDEVIPGYLDTITDAELFSFYTDKYDLYFMRTRSWLKWRYSKPYSKYINFGIDNASERGFMVLKEFIDTKTGIRKLHIVDFGYNNLNCLSKLLDHSVFMAKAKNSHILNLWHYALNQKETDLLLSKSFKMTGEKNSIIIHTLGEKLSLPEKNWHVTLYDNDVY